MSEPSSQPQNAQETPKDRVPATEYAALGCGCLLTILIFGAAILVGLTRG